VSTQLTHAQPFRAVRILKTVHAIFAEDCRHTRKLATHYGITTPLHSYHSHNEASRKDAVLEFLSRGLPVALVSDAGCPAISDPGSAAIRAAIGAGYAVVPVPGPSAVLSAVTASGLPTDNFLFVGFLPAKSTARRRQLERLRSRVTVRHCALACHKAA
jgi:16S rRNA (cytidine1402-2'-O)-methyltransferase